MKSMNIYLCGVGGQGIGLLSYVLSRACMSAGHVVRGCDTHGLAQRGGTVVSHLRLGETAHTPRVPPGQADLVGGLERLETLRALRDMLRSGGDGAYYDAVVQPVDVRRGLAPYPDPAALEDAMTGGILHRVFLKDLSDPRLQNVALLGLLAREGLVEGVDGPVLRAALEEGVPPKARAVNLEIFDRVLGMKT